MNQEMLKALKRKATVIRAHIIESVFSAASGHPGGSLSCADIMTALYFNEMNVKPEQPLWADRDRFVLSKGHCAPALYAALAEKGFFPVKDLTTLRQTESYLEGHPNMEKVPGVDMSTGSLGQGISAAVGMALAGKLDKKNYRVYTVLGDGEIQEGQVWEALMAASHYQLDNLIAFLDHNGLQIDGEIRNVLSPEPVADKFRAFGWNVIAINGHDFEEIDKALLAARNFKYAPTMIVAETVKGKGVSFMEGEAGWHGKAPGADEREIALSELNRQIEELEEE